MSGSPLFACPHCGADLAAGASFCRECGASDDAGWGERAEGYGGELADGDADDEFDYDDFVRREFPSHASGGPKRSPRRLIVSLIVVLICLAICALQLGW